MNSTPPAPPAGGVRQTPDRDNCIALVRRVAGSDVFLKSPRLRQFLLFVGNRATTEPSQPLTEQEIGIKVFGRSEGYSTGEDSLVRVEARQLRRKLDAYFATAGRDEPLVITIPKGSYVPQFGPRMAEEGLPAVQAPVRRSPKTTPFLLGFLGLALGFLAGLFWKGSLGPAAETRRGAGTLPWSAVFERGRRTNIVMGDTSLVILEEIARQDALLEDYAGTSYPQRLIDTVPDGPLRSALRLISGFQYTSMVTANAASHMLKIADRSGVEASLRFPRDLSVRDFKSDNFILIGGKPAIPWVQLFEPDTNFVLMRDDATRALYFLNRVPRAGEQTTYRSTGERDRSQETFALLALVPNAQGTGNVLLLNGPTTESIEAAAEFLFAPGFPSTLAKISGSGRSPRFFEALVHIKALVKVPVETEVVAWRLRFQ
jgi:hypothetical protein